MATPTLVGGPPSGAGDRHQAAHGLHHEVVPREVDPDPGPEAGDRAVDDPRVRGPHRREVEAEAGQPAGAEVLHHHVGPPGQGVGCCVNQPRLLIRSLLDQRQNLLLILQDEIQTLLVLLDFTLVLNDNLLGVLDSVLILFDCVLIGQNGLLVFQKMLLIGKNFIL